MVVRIDVSKTEFLEFSDEEAAATYRAAKYCGDEIEAIMQEQLELFQIEWSSLTTQEYDKRTANFNSMQARVMERLGRVKTAALKSAELVESRSRLRIVT